MFSTFPSNSHSTDNLSPLVSSRRPFGRSSTIIRALKWRFMKRAESTQGIPFCQLDLDIIIPQLSVLVSCLEDITGYHGNSKSSLILQQILCATTLSEVQQKKMTFVLFSSFIVDKRLMSVMTRARPIISGNRCISGAPVTTTDKYVFCDDFTIERHPMFHVNTF